MNLNKTILSNLSAEQLQEIHDRIRSTKINILLVGGTGVGKSSTINALFQNYGLESDVVIGQAAKPETLEIDSYELDNLIIWDTPGLGDSTKKDEEHKEKITALLKQKDEQGNPLIDLVFLILDASSRDFSSAYTLIKEVIIPELNKDEQDRILIGINQADQASKGYHWDKERNRPEPPLIERLEEITQSVKERLKEEAGLDIEPIYYSAGCIINDEVLSRPYNLQKLLSFIMARLPVKKRAVVANSINEEKKNFQSNDGKEDYKQKIDESVFDSFMYYVKEVSRDIYNSAKSIVTDPKNIQMAATFVFSTISTFFKKK